MADSSKENDPRYIARQYTARIKMMLLGKTAATATGGNSPVPPSVPPPLGGSGQVPASGPLPSVSAPASRSPSSPTCDSAPPTRVTQLKPPPPLPANPYNSLRSVEEHLQRSNGRFAELLSQIQRLHRLNQLLRAFLPAHLQDHVALARLDVDAWVVQTDSSVWQTRLRYLLPTLRQPLSEKLGFAVPPPQVRIVPPEAPPKAPPIRRMTMTETTVQKLEEDARQFSDPRLSAAVRRLAEHGRQRNQQS